MNCYHCADPLIGPDGNFSHRCSDGNIPSRVPAPAGGGQMIQAFYGCGCSTTYVSWEGLGALRDRLDAGMIRLRCQLHRDGMVVRFEHYEPRFSSDLPPEYYDGELEDAIEVWLAIIANQSS